MASALTRAAPYFIIGLLGRSKRDLDAAELMVIHVEDNRGAIMQ